MIVVAIHLKVQSQRQPPIPFLSIPLSDIERLSTRPFKWLRYVMFSICGARGDLSATLDGPPVNYDNLSLAEHTYYYHPSGQGSHFMFLTAVYIFIFSANCVFLDHEALNDRITSTWQTTRGLTFRRDVKTRDQCCIITGDEEELCDAAHLIPRSTGSEVIIMLFVCHP